MAESSPPRPPLNRPLHRSDPPEMKTPSHQGEMRRPTAAQIGARRSATHNRALGAFADITWEDPANVGQPAPPPRPHPKLIERNLEANRQHAETPPPGPSRPTSPNRVPPPSNAIDPEARLKAYRETPSSQQRVIAEPINEPEEEIIPEPAINRAPNTKLDTPAVLTRSKTNYNYERLGIPSTCIPYDFADINFRKFDPFDLAKLHRARVEQSDPLMLDVLDGTIDQDARDLSVGDFNFLMYRQRLDSYLHSPFKINYKSRYGNDCEVILNDSNLKIIKLEMSQEEYDDWKAQGLVIPTMRDWELAQVNKLDVEQTWLWGRAQYLYVPLTGDPKQNLFEEKITLLQENGTEGLERIRDYSERIKHGVEETVDVTDNKFEPKTAIEYLRQRSTELRQAAEVFSSADIAVMQLIVQSNELSDEADLIEATIAKNETYKPRGEQIPLSIDLLSFFPQI
jgi:hypothetical protein